jgi:hypothetical protein
MSPSTPPAPREVSWERFVDGLRAFVARRVPHRDADDVAQEAMLRIHRGAGGLRDPERLQAWVYSIARHAIADYYRARPASEATEPVPPESVADPSAAVAAGFADFDGEHDVHEFGCELPIIQQLATVAPPPGTEVDFVYADGRIEIGRHAAPAQPVGILPLVPALVDNGCVARRCFVVVAVGVGL